LKPPDELEKENVNSKAKKFYTKLQQRNNSSSNILETKEFKLKDRFADNAVVNEIEGWREEDNQSDSDGDALNKPLEGIFEPTQKKNKRKV
jgi:hypothetical protein